MDLPEILYPQGLLGRWKCRCTHMEELGNSPHLSAEPKKMVVCTLRTLNLLD